MEFELTSQQRMYQLECRAFVEEAVIPYAGQHHSEERTSPEMIRRLAQQRYLGAIIPKEYGGMGMDFISYGLLCEELGRGCSSLRSLVTVHSMVAYALLKWGSKAQKENWLPRLASGEVIAAFGLSEPNVGSDAKSVETLALSEGSEYLLTGQKKWITYGQIADVFLIFARCESKPTAFLVERHRPGLTTKPLSGLLGLRASMTSEISMNECRIPGENLVGRIGAGFSHISSLALHCGRYSVAWGCVGILQACLEASIEYTQMRKQFNAYIGEYQLIRRMLTDMVTNVKAARLLCYQAGYLQDIGDPTAVMETSIAKYFASTAAVKAASDAVQLHGANGCSSDYPVQRYLGDAKVMEIIEGSTQMHQITIAEYAYQECLLKKKE